MAADRIALDLVVVADRGASDRGALGLVGVDLARSEVASALVNPGRARPLLVKLPSLACPARVRTGLAFTGLLTGTGMADATLTGVDLTGAASDTPASATDVRGDTSGD